MADLFDLQDEIAQAIAVRAACEAFRNARAVSAVQAEPARV